jgi:hypothetical protein
MLDVERSFFDKKRADLASRFPGQFVVIKAEETVGLRDRNLVLGVYRHRRR